MEPIVNPNQDEAVVAVKCPSCGGPNVSTSIKVQEFTYGTGKESVTLSAAVALRSCGDCGFAFLDSSAEEAQHDAICRHLHVMPPRQIRNLRELLGYSQAQFAEMSMLGEATVSRWERGAVIQNPAYDNYLYLLGFHDNRARLLEREQRETSSPSDPLSRKFKILQITDAVLNRQSRFRLQSA